MTHCHCGRKLHYTCEMVERWVLKMIKELGYYITVTSTKTGKSYKVPRHYIALHGLKGDKLDKLGFEEIKATA